MKVLKMILLGLLVMVVLVLITALFAGKEYRVEREILIDKEVASVFGYVKQLKNQDHYNKWVMRDPQMKKTFKGTDGTVGFRYDWEGNKEAGQGEQEITGLVDNEKVEISIHFIRPFEGNAKNTIITEPVTDHKTKVISQFQSDVAYPMNIMLLFVNFDDVLGKDLEATLATLKNRVENN